MASKETSNFFGLFGCAPSKGKDFLVGQPSGSSEELEEGEIADHNESGLQENVQFDTLVASYQQELSQKLNLKNAKKCFICLRNVPQYTCPKCGLKTCSLNCCISHKKKFNCSGVRDRLSFVPLKSYSNQSFNSDVTFLEEASGVVVDSSRFLHNNSTKDFSNWTNRFIQEAVKRKIQYKKLPPLFKKAKLNKSLFIYKEKAIFWDIEFILPNCFTSSVTQENNLYYEEFSSFTYKKSRISENLILSEIIENIITNENYFSETETLESKESAGPQLSAYIKASRNNVIALFKHDSGKFYFILDQNKTLLQNFVDKTIVEYPTIVIVLKQFLKDYPIKNTIE